MRLLFISDYALPQVYRGVEVNTHALCTVLREAGHDVAVLAGLTPHGLLGALERVELKLIRRRFWVRDTVMGYPVFRAWLINKVIGDVARHWRPDILIVQGCSLEIAESALATGFPAIVYFHFTPLWPGVPDPARVRFLTNSEFCARRVMELHGVSSTIVRPIVLDRWCRTTVERKEVTSVGLSIAKGADQVLDLAARLPGLVFRIFGNDAPGEEQRALLRRAALLPNLRTSPRQRSGRTLYGRTRVLLAPSRAEETWGRVVTEAHVNEIPVLASDRGGLPESVGSGGACLSLDAPLDIWASALHAMMEDDAHYARIRQAIRAHKASPGIAPDAIRSDFLKAIA